MNRDELLELISSWENLALIIKDFGQSQENFNLLMEIALNSTDPTSWRAAWMADKIHDNYPWLTEPYLPLLIEKMKTEKHHGKNRHFLKLVSMHDVPKEYESFLIDYSLDKLTDGKQSTSLRVHAMQVMYNISEKIPELKQELLEIIENEMNIHPAPGIVARGRKLAGKIREELNRKF